MSGPIFSQGALYKSARPTYPLKLIQSILEYAGGDGRKNIAVDIGCGTGQLTVQLAGHYKQVIGVDSSTSQLSNAEAAPGVEYTSGDAVAYLESLPEGTVDLVTCAQTAHWLPAERFQAAISHALRAGGTAAVVGYGLLSFDGGESTKAANELFREYHFKTMGPYWAAGRDLLDAGLPHITDLGCEIVERRQLPMPHAFSEDRMRSYLETWSCLAEFKKQHPNEPTPLEKLWPNLLNLLKVRDSDGDIPITFPITLILAKNPKK